MQRYEFSEGFPYLATSPLEGFRIRDCMVFRVREGEETTSWDFWNYAIDPPDAFPVDWVRQFWRDLAAAPHFTSSEDQWSSYYYSLLSDTVVHWTDDRQQGASFLHKCTGKDEFASDRYTPRAVREWLATHLAAESKKDA